MGVLNIGSNRTFMTNFTCYYLIGASFGCSHNLMEVNSIDFVKTGKTNKFLRALLAFFIVYGAWSLLGTIDNKFDEYFYMVKAFYCLLVPFFILGPYTLLCLWLGLVKNEEEEERNETEF